MKIKRHENEQFCTITKYVRTYRLSINLFPNGFINSVAFLVSPKRLFTNLYSIIKVFSAPNNIRKIK